MPSLPYSLLPNCLSVSIYPFNSTPVHTTPLLPNLRFLMLCLSTRWVFQIKHAQLSQHFLSRLKILFFLFHLYHVYANKVLSP